MTTEALETAFNRSIEFKAPQMEIIRAPITRISDEVFGKTAIKAMYIHTNPNMTEISGNAFAGSENYMEELYISRTGLSSTSVFSAINKLKKLKTLTMSQNQVSDVHM